MKKFAFILAMLPFVLTLPQLPAQAQEQCIESDCQVRFDYTGDYQVWDVPPGAKNVSVQLYGAQGGKTGGRGGKLTADLTEPTPSRLYIFVGGAGTSAALAPGGYNGGGQAGSSHGDEGSGGGATDVRTTLSLQDRILVAGGGGGTGGWSGGQGGNGGGLVGQDGTAGQGGSGRGGSQISGGNPGSSNGGYVGSAGGLGFGGSGGISSSAGGGGGGGGYYGGGGGGADVDSCCSDGGGGGGGSSWAYAAAINVSDTQGANQGNGYVIISYQLEYRITASDITQLTQDSFQLSLSFNLPIELAVTDFAVPHSCTLELASIDNLVWHLNVRNCKIDPAVVEFFDSSGRLGTKLQNLPMRFSLPMDITGPVVNYEPYVARTSADAVRYEFAINEAVDSTAVEMFELTGCESLALTQLTHGYQLDVHTCLEGPASIRLPAGSLTDQYGNTGPVQDLVWNWELDQTGPDIEIIHTDPGVLAPFEFSVSVLADGEELADLTPILIELGSSDCLVQNLGSQLLFTDCLEGDITLTIPADTVSDDLGNLGPAADSVSMLQLQLPPMITPDPVTPDVDAGSQAENPSIPVAVEPDLLEPPAESPSPMPVVEEVPDEQIESEPDIARIEEELQEVGLVQSDEVSAVRIQAPPGAHAELNAAVPNIELEESDPTPIETSIKGSEPSIIGVAAPSLPSRSVNSDFGTLHLLMIAVSAIALGALAFGVWRFIGK